MSEVEGLGFRAFSRSTTHNAAATTLRILQDCGSEHKADCKSAGFSQSTLPVVDETASMGGFESHMQENKEKEFLGSDRTGFGERRNF
jgi:hypothetical protein